LDNVVGAPLSQGGRSTARGAWSPNRGPLSPPYFVAGPLPMPRSRGSCLSQERCR
jgi:hypothetical protein